MECLKGFVAAAQSGNPLSHRRFGSFSDDLNVGFCQISAIKSMDEFPQKECSFIDVTSSYNWDSLFVTKITCHGIFKHRGFSKGFLQNFPMFFFNKNLSSPWGPPSNLRCRKPGENLQDYVLYLYTSKAEQSQVRKPEGCQCGEFPQKPDDMDSMGSERYIYSTFNYPNQKSTIRCK